MVVTRKEEEAEITEQGSLLIGAGDNKPHIYPKDKHDNPIHPVNKGTSHDPVCPTDKGKGPALPVNNGANGNKDNGTPQHNDGCNASIDENVFPDLQMRPIGGNVDKICIVPGRLYQKLQPHQQEGLHWLWRTHCQRCGGIVADDMGMGKTLQTAVFLSALLHSDIIRRAMVIVPVSVLDSWSEELTEAGLVGHFQMYYGSNERGLHIVDEKGGILVTTYETYSSKHKVLIEVDWDYTVLDEAHRIRNLNSIVREQMDKIVCEKKLLLTGTPLPRDLLDIYSLMKFVNPDVLGGLDTFHKKYMRPVRLGQYLDSTESNKKQFMKALANSRKVIAPYILRRTKSVLIESGVLPCKKIEVIVWLRLTNLQVELYSKFSKLIDQESHTWRDKDRSTITQTIIGRHICNGPQLLLEKFDGGQGNTVRRLAKKILDSIDEETCQNIESSCKLSFIMDLIKLFEEEKKEEKAKEEKSKKDKAQVPRKRKKLKILVFSQFISMLDRIEIALKAIGKEGNMIRIDGSMKREERDEKIKKFGSQDKDSPSIFLLSAKVGGEGLNLTAATRVIIVDPSWNLSDDNQIADRVFRFGQKDDVTIYRLVACMTIEEDIYNTQMIKGNLAKALLEGMVCSPLVEFEEHKFIRLPECGFNSSKTQQMLETLMGDTLEMSSGHKRFLQKHHLVAGLTNQEAVSSYEAVSLSDLALSESSDDEASSSEEEQTIHINKLASRHKQGQQNGRSMSEKFRSCRDHSKNRDPVSKYEEDAITVTSRESFIPANKVGALIGKGGEAIEMIKRRSATTIIANPDGHRGGKFPDPCPVQIRGTVKEITKAEKLILEVLSEGDKKCIEGAPNGGIEIHFSVPQDMVGLIIGRGGRSVQCIEDESGARVNLMKDESKFRISGTSEEVNSAKKMMSDIMSKHTGSSSRRRQIQKQDRQAQVSGESTSHRPPGRFYTPRATGLGSGYSGERVHDHLYKPVAQQTLQPPPPPQGMPYPHARSEYYGERGTRTAFRPPGIFEHQWEGQNYHPRIGPDDFSHSGCNDVAQGGTPNQGRY